MNVIYNFEIASIFFSRGAGDLKYIKFLDARFPDCVKIDKIRHVSIFMPGLTWIDRGLNLLGKDSRRTHGKAI